MTIILDDNQRATRKLDVGCLRLRIGSGQKIFKIRKNASYQVFKNLDRMRFIMEIFTSFSPQIEFLPRLSTYGKAMLTWFEEIFKEY